MPVYSQNCQQRLDLIVQTQAIDLGYQYVDPQAQMGVQEHPVALPQFGDLGTNHAFLNKGDGDGQSTKDRMHFQQLAIKQVCMRTGCLCALAYAR